MWIYKANPRKASAGPNPLLEAALALARRGWPVLPVWPFWLHPHILRPCAQREPICLATGWHALTLESFLHATTDEATIREWWATWSDAYVCVCALMTPDLKARPWWGDEEEDEEFGIIVFGWRDGKIRVAVAEAVIWGAHEEAHDLFRALERLDRKEGHAFRKALAQVLRLSLRDVTKELEEEVRQLREETMAGYPSLRPEPEGGQ